MSPGEIRILLLILTGIALLLYLNILLAGILPGGEWLHLRWSGARAFVFERVEPYSAAIAERTQQIVYGRNAAPGEYAYVLNDPFYIVLLYLPLALISDFSIARGIWMAFAESALIGSILFAVRLAEWEPPRWMLISLIVFSLFGYYSLQSLVSGSVSVFLLFLYLCVLLALRSANDELAGALLFLCAYQWEVGVLFFFFILVAVFANRRWGVLAGFGMSLFVMVVVSFLAYRGWGLPYIRAVLSDWYGGANLNLNTFVSNWFPGSRIPIAGVSAFALGAIVFFEWIGALRSPFRRIVWTAALSVSAAPLLGFAIFRSNHVVLIFPLIMILALVWERWRRRRFFAAALVLVATAAIPFGFHAGSIYFVERIYPDLLTLLPPVAALVGLYWMRWQVVRGSRPWIEQVGARQ